MHEFHLDTTLGRGASASPVPDGVFRLLLVGDFSGAGDETPSAAAVAARAPRRVDLDTAESVLRAWGPQVRLAGIAGQPAETLRVDGFEALTPDGLVSRLATVAAVRRAVDQPSAPPPARGGAVRGGGVLDAILDEATPADPLTAMHEAGGDLSAFIEAALRGHTVTAADRDAAARGAAREAATDAVVRAVLRDPAFRAVESLWLSVQQLTRRLEAVSGVEVWLLDLSPAALAVALPPGGDPLTSPMARLLRAAGAEVAWSVMALAWDVTGALADIDRVAQLATLGAAIGAPWVLGGAPALTGFDTLADAAAADEWPAAPPAWTAFRQTALARWVSVVPNGVLARAPYGRDGEQVDRPFEEWEPGARHGPNAWMPPSYGAVLALGLSYDAATSRVRAAGAYAIDGLPFVMAAGTPVPAGQVLVSERGLTAFAARGLTVFETHKSAGVVRLRGLWSCAVPPQPVAGSFWENG